jgi:hypothetical protein
VDVGCQAHPVSVDVLVTQNSLPSGSARTVSGFCRESGSTRTSMTVARADQTSGFVERNHSESLAGALAAVPGLLLVALLASGGEGVLGKSFSTVWSDPYGHIALAISTRFGRFGLVGGLIGSLAVLPIDLVDAENPQMHRNAPLTQEGRFRLCCRIEDGRTVAAAAESMNISRQTATSGGGAT